MRINGSSLEPIRPERPAAPASDQRGDNRGAQPNGTGAAKSDSVQISDAGRSLAGRASAEHRTSFDPERVAELRTKVLTGAYNTLDVVDQVARRILSRGDL